MISFHLSDLICSYNSAFIVDCNTRGRYTVGTMLRSMWSIVIFKQTNFRLWQFNWKVFPTIVKGDWKADWAFFTLTTLGSRCKLWENVRRILVGFRSCWTRSTTTRGWTRSREVGWSSYLANVLSPPPTLGRPDASAHRRHLYFPQYLPLPSCRLLWFLSSQGQGLPWRLA